MTDQEVEDFLEHFGVKGMKWGHRKASDEPSRGERRAAKKLEKADKKWEKKAYSSSTQIDIHNAMAKKFNANLSSLNDNPKFKDKDLTKDPKLMADYDNEADKMMEKYFREAVPEVVGKSPSGNKEAVFVRDETSGRMEIRDRKVEHADKDFDADLSFPVKLNKLGHIVSVDMATGTVVHQDVDDFLAHYGVKGMKWGRIRQANRDRMERVASGKSSLADKVVTTAFNVSSNDIIKGGGLAGAARKKLDTLDERDEAIKAGLTKTKDILKKAGHKTVTGLQKVDKAYGDYEKKKRDLEVEAFMGDLFGVNTGARQKLDTARGVEKAVAEGVAGAVKNARNKRRS